MSACLFYVHFFLSALEEKMISTKREYLGRKKISNFPIICNLMAKRDPRILNKIYSLFLYVNFVFICQIILEIESLVNHFGNLI